MSLFQLPMAPPSPDHGVSSMYMQKVEPNQPVREDAGFGSQKIQFQINPAANEWFIPNRSYFRIRFEVQVASGNGAAFLPIGTEVEATGTSSADKVAYRWVPAYGMCSRLFNGCNFYVGSTLVSSISSNLPQVDTIHKRTTLSRTQLETTEGFYQSSPNARLGQLLGIADPGSASVAAPSANAIPALSNATATQFETIWSPPLGISDIAHGMPSGQYRWEFNGNPTFANDVCDGLGVLERVPGTDYKFTMKGMVLYACYARGPSGEDTKFALNMKQIRVQGQQLSDAKDNPSLQLKNFDVEADTSALAIAFQGTASNVSGTNRYGGPGLFKIGALSEQKRLERWYISYDNSVYPPEQNEDLYGGVSSLIQQRYRDNMTQTGMVYSPGGAETIDQWLNQIGPYYLVNWPRIQGTATRVQVNAQIPTQDAAQCLLISISEQSFLIRTSDGKVRKVEIGE